MKKWLFLAGLVFVGALAWRIGSRLSSDAVSMALGVMFGVLAGVPTAILMLAGQHFDPAQHKRQQDARLQRYDAPAQPPQPPVIVLVGGERPSFPYERSSPGGSPARQLYVVDAWHEDGQS